jgi:REP element-mobilizing transposase RayT
MPKPWNGWYHVEGNTYGTWLRGDFRGWREWNHHEHVEGDYRSPPDPADCLEPFLQSRRAMKRPPVKLTPSQRRAAGRAMVEMLVRNLGCEVLAFSLDAVHFHVLCRIPGGQVREEIGRAKKHASHVLGEAGLKGSVWARRCGVTAIRNRAHQVSAYRYILRHGRKGAWTWTYREGLDWTAP